MVTFNENQFNKKLCRALLLDKHEDATMICMGTQEMENLNNDSEPEDDDRRNESDQNNNEIDTVNLTETEIEAENLDELIDL